MQLDANDIDGGHAIPTRAIVILAVFRLAYVHIEAIVLQYFSSTTLENSMDIVGHLVTIGTFIVVMHRLWELYSAKIKAVFKRIKEKLS